MTKKSFVFLVGLVQLSSLLFRGLVPPFPSYGDPHDDGLMVNLAQSIIKGEWLGSYLEQGHILLSKPPGYPMFLAYSHFLPWAPTISVHLLILFGGLILVRELRALDFSREICLLALALIAFLPVWFNEQMSRIYRDGFLAGLSMLAIALTFVARRHIIVLINNDKLGVHNIRRLAITTVCLGIVVGTSIITKPSWHLLATFILITVFFTVPFRGRGKKKMTLVTASFVFLLFAVSMLPSAYVKSQNSSHYGVRVVDTFSAGGFTEAMKAIYGVKDYENRAFVDVTKSMRTRIYKISPTFKKLEPYLELPDGAGWRSQPCAQALAVCDESAGWFPWDLRDAVQNAGLGIRATDFETAMSQIAKDIRTACTNKLIKCENEGLAAGLDSLDSLSPRTVLDAFTNGVSQILNPSAGYLQRSINKDLSPEVGSIWRNTINGLPKNSVASEYEIDDNYLGDTRKLLGNLYQSFWVLLFIVSFVMLFLPARGADTKKIKIFGLASVASIAIFLLQLSLLQASSGFYMGSGGVTYLICVYPFLLFFIVNGLHLFQIRNRATPKPRIE
jgi:hypothetical protein